MNTKLVSSSFFSAVLYEVCLTATVLLINLAPCRSQASSLETVSYDQLLLIQKTDTKKHHVDISVQYLNNLSHPHYSLFGSILKLDYWFNDKWAVGIHWAELFPSETELYRTLNLVLAPVPMKVTFITPLRSGHAVLSYSMLRGLLNILNSHIVDSDFVLGLGVGSSLHTGGDYFHGVSVSLEERLQICKSFGVVLGYSHIVEHNFSSSSGSSRGYVSGGIYVRL